MSNFLMDKEIKVYSEVECTIYSKRTEGFILDDRPIVTVAVTTYNSSKYIIETLDSIKAQTYNNIILQISDDCSKDNTFDVCMMWIKKNQNRFYKTKYIYSQKNTGVSANCNRHWDECESEWLKGIAGDDILLPCCVETYMDYIQKNPEAIIIFGKAMAFYTKREKLIKCGYIHNYDYFSLSPKELHYQLIWNGNKLPAASAFYNIRILTNMGFRHDTRIRNIEDYPKWIRLSGLGIKFHYINKDTVLYRCEETSLSVGIFSPNYYYQEILLCLYYYLDEIKHPNEKDAIYNLIAEHCTKFYTVPYTRCRNSIEYKVGKVIMRPLFVLRKILFKLGILKNKQ